ncbi:MAG: phosphatase PAP2 family protein [Clostridium sp.]
MELEILRSIQSFSNPFLDFLFEGMTIMGEGAVLIAILTSIYWAVDKDLGEYIAFSFFTSMLLNNFIKDIFKSPRPVGKEGIRSLRVETATGYSFPSGHSQAAATFYGALAIYIKKNYLYIVSIIIILLIGLSRLYLGVHYPKDVIVGIILGLITSWICYMVYTRVKNKLLLYLGVFIVFLPVLFMENSPDFIKSLGGYFGFLIGMWFEKTYINFTINRNTSKKIVRVLIGLILVGGLQGILKIIFPLGNIFDFLRYAIMSFVGIGVYPLVFKKFNI